MSVLPSKTNEKFIRELDALWTITDDGNTSYKIAYFKRKGEGNKQTVTLKATPSFFDDLDNDRHYVRKDEHLTAQSCFDFILSGTDYEFRLVGSFHAVQWQGLGDGETKLKSFKRALKRYNAEFEIVGNIVYIRNLVGNDTQFQYRHGLNASNVTKEVDAKEYWTYAKGFGNYEDGKEDEAKLLEEYTSPLAAVLGKRHAPPIKDGRVTNVDTMKASLKRLVDESLVVSVSADIHDLRNQGYPLAQAKVGDRVFLTDERIGFDEEVRVIALSVTKNWRGKVIDAKITFGSRNLTKRHQSKIQTATDNITEVMEGRKEIPFSALAKAAKQATLDLQNVQTEIQTPTSGGLLAVNKDNPNLVVLFNSAGIGISEDGGATFKTSMTGAGIVADTITTGTLFGITIISDDGLGGRVILDKGAIQTFQDDAPVMSVDRSGLSLDYSDGVVGTLRAVHRVGDLDARGIDFMGEKDYISIGFKSGIESQSISLISLSDVDRHASIYGSTDMKDNGSLLLQSTKKGGTANGLVPEIEIDNETVSGRAYSGVRLKIGRDNRSPFSDDFSSNFEIRQYIGDGKGGSNMLLDIDSDSTGKSYVDVMTDKLTLPSETSIRGGNGHVYPPIAHYSSSDNPILVKNFINGPYTLEEQFTGGYVVQAMSDVGEILGINTQAVGTGTEYMSTSVTKYSATSFEVLYAKTQDFPGNLTDIYVHTTVFYKPK